MEYKEAMEWLKGNRCTINTIPKDPIETWEIRITQADSAFMQIAYWVVKAHKEGLLK